MSGPYDNQYAYNQGYQGYPQYEQTAYTGYEQYNTYPQQGYAAQSCNTQPPEQARYYSQSYDPSYQSQPQYGQYQQPGQEADRGVLGALGGGAAGGFAGHKAGHGILGTIGGAIVGHLTEDFAKQKRNKNRHGRKNEHLPGSAATSGIGNGNGSTMSGGLGSMASSFFSNQKR